MDPSEMGGRRSKVHTATPLLDPTSSSDASKRPIMSDTKVFTISVWALMIKNFHVKRRHYFSLTCELLLPVLFVVCFTMLKSLNSTKDYDEGWTLSSSTRPQSVYGEQYTNSYSDNRLMQTNTNTMCDLIRYWTGEVYSDCAPFLSNSSKIALTSDNPNDHASVVQFAEFVNSNFCNLFNNYTIFYPSTDDLDDYIRSGDYTKNGNPRVITAIVFHTIGQPGQAMAWDYSIRMNVSANWDCNLDVTSTIGTKLDKLQNGIDTSGQDNYFGAGFVRFQAMVDRVILNMHTSLEGCTTAAGVYGNCELYYAPQSIYSIPMPVRAWTENPFYSQVITYLPLIYLLSFLFTLFVVLAAMVEEKELKIKEGLVIMGLSENAITLSWYLTYILIVVFESIVIAAVCRAGLGSKFPGMFPKSDVFAIFLLFVLFGMSVVSYCFMISAFFSRSKVAGVVGVVIFFIAFFTTFGIDTSSEETKNWVCLMPQVAFSLAITTGGKMEGAGLGVTFGNMYDSYDNFRFYTALLMLLVDNILYTILGWYLNKVIPREWGVVQPWYFPFSPNYWNPKKIAVQTEEGANQKPLPPSVEPVAAMYNSLREQGRCIDIRGLRKEFDTPDGTKVAVDSLDLTMYEGQVFALLGHNGAGKTTTINMLCGMLPISGGSASILGYDVATQMSAARRTMGMCPQHDVLYPDLTVREHLELFGRIKGLFGSTLDREVRDKISEVALVEKTDVLARALSGGMKRKLSVAIALLGDSKVVFLDEPTSGMDPYSRRFTWEVLRKNREGRIMVLTTHFMDEADLLGDRIAIMGSGQLRCCGTSLFLKKRYGQGYNLTITKGAGCDVPALQRMVKSNVPGSELLSNVGTELTFQLPVEATSRFPSMLRQFEQEGETLGVLEYGMSVTTMEEIFIRVARDGDVTVDDKKRASQHVHQRLSNAGSSASAGHPPHHYDSTPDHDHDQDHDNHNHDDANGDHGDHLSNDGKTSTTAAGQTVVDVTRLAERPRASPLAQIAAVYKKRALCARRDYKAFMCVVLVPLLLVLAGLLILKYTGILKDDPSMDVSPSNVFKQTPLDFHFTIPRESNGLYNSSMLSTVNDMLSLVPQSAPKFMNFTNHGNGTMDLWGWKYFEGVPCFKPSRDTKVDDSSYVCDADHMFSDYYAREFLREGSAADILLLGKSDEIGWWSSPLYASAMILDADLVGGSFSYLVFQNTSSPHGSVSLINSLNDALARKQSGGAKTITTRNHPFPVTHQQTVFQKTIKSFVTTIFVMIGTAFIPASMVAFIVRERESVHNAKHLQLLSGCEIVSYWVANVLWDLTSYIPFFVLVLVMMRAFSINALLDNGAVGAVLCLFIGFGYAIVPFSYLWSFLFSSASAAQIWLVLINFIVNLFLTLVSFMMGLSSVSSSVHSVNDILRYFYRLFPGFCVGDGMYSLSLMNLIDVLETDTDNKKTAHPFGWKVTGGDLCFLFAYGTLYFILVLLIDVLLSFPSLRAAIFPDPRGPPENQAHEIDEDVAAEQQRVTNLNPHHNFHPDADAVVVKSLRKVYRSGKPAVRQLQFGIRPGECFGLLGINGAGKTTTMKILTGDVVPSDGHAYLGGFSVLTELRKVRKIVGYCPQFDALTELLSVREHLELYCRLKGVAPQNIPSLVMQKMTQLDLLPFANKLAGTLSGGNKRKLSVAIATIGDPPIIFLDEPSTGMDPVARRFMWDIIADVTTGPQRCTVILTTHSMEECEALCTQVAIMVGGRFRCLGNVQHLKERFGTGFTVDIKVRNDTTNEAGPDDKTPVVAAGPSQASETTLNNIVADFDARFPGSAVVERSANHAVFRLPQENMRVSTVFEEIEANKERLDIVEYSVSQATLEQIFNSFAKMQEEETGPAPGMAATSVPVPTQQNTHHGYQAMPTAVATNVDSPIPSVDNAKL